jgi:hypothetical protein
MCCVALTEPPASCHISTTMLCVSLAMTDCTIDISFDNIYFASLFDLTDVPITCNNKTSSCELQVCNMRGKKLSLNRYKNTSVAKLKKTSGTM